MHKINHPVRRIAFLCFGLMIMAFGVAFSIKGALGTSPISSVPYVTAKISGLSVGTTTIIMNFVFVLIQIAILRSQYDWLQLLQFPAAIVFGTMIDVAGYVLQAIAFSNYVQQWLLCIAGIFLIALGISLEVTANLVTTAGEGIVLAICRVVPVKFSNMKIIFDVTLVCISIVLSFVFLGHLDGVREGTVAAAIFVGLITKQTNRLMNHIESILGNTKSSPRSSKIA
ncbi:YitT family protein [Pseudoflavonifractor phocaeensis]|nr:YitT family protein [Pseudoflavonifractor phocaeensis]